MKYLPTWHGWPPQVWDGKKWVYVKQENQMTNLPAFLQNYQKRNLTETSAVGVSLLPPHISIRGNRFALVDGSGERQEVQTLHLDCCIFDVSEVICKMYYDNEWAPDADDPPVCWSSNGVGPSVDAIEPQSETCATCKNNERGSATSKLTGTAIKACRDEKYFAVMIPYRTDMVFRLVLTPGSFKNWDKFRNRFVGQQQEYDVVLTRLEFESGKNGVLTFTPVSYVDEGLYNACRQALAGKATDLICGRLDRPRGGVLLGRTQETVRIAPPPANLQAAPALQAQSTIPAGNQAAPPAQEQPRRRRRTREEIEADARREAEAKAAQQASQEVRAPFRPDGNDGAQFGIAGSVPPNREVEATLDSIFR